MDVAEVTKLYLLYVVMPLWVLVAFADYWCHRASDIEHTSGLKETGIHFLLLAEAGSGVLAGLLFEINFLVILFMALAFIAHEITAYWDVRYAYSRRDVTPLEQRIHDYLGVIPFMAFSFVLVLNWEAILLLAGEPLAPENWHLWWKNEPLPASYIAGLLLAILFFDLLPYAEEFWRDWRERSRKRRSLRLVPRQVNR